MSKSTLDMLDMPMTAIFRLDTTMDLPFGEVLKSNILPSMDFELASNRVSKKHFRHVGHGLH